jgi:two-component system response regulator AtoC
MTKVLVVEDADSLREVLCSVLESEGFEVTSCASGEEALPILKVKSFDCILSDYKLPSLTGIDLLLEARKVLPAVPFVIMTAYGSIQLAVEAMKQGATDFISKPFEPQTLCDLLNQVIKHRRIIDRSAGLRSRRERRFLTQDVSVEKILAQAKKVAAVDTSALILGESGTGKELLARFIHEHSPRRDQPFVAINCAATPDTLLESEFFGHEAGAFTGATQTRPGLFEVASGGTIFLDEVGDMPLTLQVKLLRALQEREIKRVGGTKTIKINPRIIAATNKNVEEAILAGALREDFYYRLAVITFTIPSLRERKGDIELLTQSYLEGFGRSTGKTLSLGEAAKRVLVSYPWPGNARELENVIERASVLAEGEIAPEHLGISLPLDFKALSEAGETLTQVAQQAAQGAEIKLITQALRQTKGNKTQAAQMLGVSYKTLLNKVKEYELGIPVDDALNSDSDESLTLQ